MEVKSTEISDNEKSETKTESPIPSRFSIFKRKIPSQKQINPKDFNYIYDPIEQNPRIRDRINKLKVEKNKGNIIDLLRKNQNADIKSKKFKSKKEKSLQPPMVDIPSEISLEIKSKFDLTSIDADPPWDGINEYLQHNSVIQLKTDLDIQGFQINQFPGVTVLLYLKTQLTSSNISLPVIILPKPFSSSKIEKMLTKYSSGNVKKINIYCGLCNKKFYKANAEIEELYMVEYITGKTEYRIFYICVICSFKSKDRTTTENHIFEHIISKETFCPACYMSNKFRKENKINIVKEQFDDKKPKEEIHKNSSNISCDYCETFLLQEQELLNKIMVTSPYSKINDNKCSICEKIMHENSDIKIHLSSHIKSAYIYCSDCHLSKHDYKLANSIIQEHQNNISEKSATNERLKQDQNVTEEDHTENIPSE